MSSGRETGYTNSRTVTASGDHNTYAGSPDSSKTNFTINLGTNLQQVNRVSFLSVQFRNNAYNVNNEGGGKNNTFAVTVNGVTVDFAVEEGFYTTSTLMSAVQTAIQAELTSAGDGQTFALSQSALSQKVQALYGEGSSGNPTMTLEQADGKAGVWELLGFVVTSPLTLTTGVASVATNLPQLGGLTTVYLQSKALAPGNMFDVDGQQKSYCLAIPVTVPFGVENIWECKVDRFCELTYNSPRNLQLIDFALVDKTGQLIDFQGGNLIINLRVWFQRY